VPHIFCLNQTSIFSTILIKLSNTTFHENPPAGSFDVGRHDEANMLLATFPMQLKTHLISTLSYKVQTLTLHNRWTTLGTGSMEVRYNNLNAFFN
jgi:hypothetical protein